MNHPSNIADLRNRCSQGEQFDYLFFWGHQAPKNGTINSSCLSQWYPSPFKIKGINYHTAEHWMMASKARLFSDNNSLDIILASTDPKTAKAQGRKVKNFDPKIWNDKSRYLVTEGNLAKFSQNKNLADFLLSTNQKIIVEASPFDKIWGIGLAASNEKAKNPNTWNGTNILGFALMDVRSIYKAS